jgi:hypothetical protein
VLELRRTTIDGANRYLAETYRPAFNVEFTVPAQESGSAFVPLMGVNVP